MGVISASDVRMLGANLEGCAHLFSPAGQFVRQVQQQSSLVRQKATPLCDKAEVIFFFPFL